MTHTMKKLISQEKLVAFLQVKYTSLLNVAAQAEIMQSVYKSALIIRVTYRSSTMLGSSIH